MQKFQIPILYNWSLEFFNWNFSIWCKQKKSSKRGLFVYLGNCKLITI